MKPDLYETIAPYYDMLHASLSDDIDFIVSLATRTPGKVLEVGCGTGRLLSPLARAGERVVGLDRSQAMLDRARQRISAEEVDVRERIRLVRADVTRLDLGEEQFGLALFSYNTFLHVPAEAAVRACRAVGRHLSPGGRLFIDVANPFLVEQASDMPILTLEGVFRDPQSGNLVTVTATNRLEEAAQILHVTWIFDASAAEGGVVERRVAQVAHHYYHLHQLDLVLEESGFKLEETYGAYGGDAFSEESERLLVLAQKVAA